jgi:hypothetical protein
MIFGASSITSTNNYALALGFQSRASGLAATAISVNNTTGSYGASGTNSVAIGKATIASGANAISIGNNTTASGSSSFAQGPQSVASGSYSIALGGLRATATNTYSVAIGSNSQSSIIGKYAYTAYRFGVNGDAQLGAFVLVSDTTDATPEALTTDNSAPGTTDQIILPNNSAYAFHGTIVARQQASQGTACAAWKIEGLIRREGSAGTTVLVNSATTVLDNTPGWGMTLSADTTNGGLKIEVTGAAATNIRWVCTANTSEVTF